MPVSLRRDELGRIAYLRSPWTPKDAEAIRRSGVRRLHISLREHDMPFLRELEGIEEVQIVALGVKSDGVVAALPDLRVLGLQNYCDDPIDFGAFKQLERLAFNLASQGRDRVRGGDAQEPRYQLLPGPRPDAAVALGAARRATDRELAPASDARWRRGPRCAQGAFPARRSAPFGHR